MGDRYSYYGYLTVKESTPQEIIDEIIAEINGVADSWDAIAARGREIDIGGEYKNNYFEEAVEPYLEYFEDSDDFITREGPGIDYGVMFQRIRNGKWEYASAATGWELKEAQDKIKELLKISRSSERSLTRGSMGRIIATCGHEIPDIGTSYATKESPGVISFRVLCDECARWYEDNSLILHSRDEEWEWMGMGEDEEEWR